MKIAIVGAPGSGKSELAAELDKLLHDDCSKCTVAIVDDYIDDIGKAAGFKLDAEAGYVGNLHVVLGRLAREQKAEAEGATHIITCGTGIETGIYVNRKAVVEQTQWAWIRATNFMNLWGSIFADTWRYDHVFVLSYPQRDVDTVNGKIDGALFMALSTFGVHFTPLSGTLEEKVEQARKTIHGDPSTSDQAPTQAPE
jgi:hypothetical protein